MRGRKYAWGKPDERKMRAETQKIDWSYCYNSIKDTILPVFRNSWPEIVSGELSDLLYLGSNSFWSKSGTLKALYLSHLSLIRHPANFRKKLWLCPTRGEANSKPGFLVDPGYRWISALWIWGSFTGGHFSPKMNMMTIWMQIVDKVGIR